MDRFRVRTKKQVSVAVVSRSASSFYQQPFRCRRSKTIAFVAIFALATSGALATASANPADIAIDSPHF
jgi:hypothetical protein